MFRKLPSLPLLRTFEAAARYLSFKKASEKLFVTPSAVSHQIKQLENQIGVKLFARYNRSIDLTLEGKLYYKEINAALRSIELATENLSRPGKSKPIHLNTFPFIATELLVPQLKRFKQEHPDIELQIRSTTQSLDFQTSKIDVAIRIGRGEWNGTVSDALIPVTLTPLCSPDFMAQNDIQSFDDLLKHPLIHNDYMKSLWGMLAHQNDCVYKSKPQDLWLDSIQSMIQAAEQGLGFTLMDVRCIPTRIQQKTLIAPFDQTLSSEEKVYLVYREGKPLSEELVAVNSWIKNVFSGL
jgi:LysR family transcriptional regulator, glycine cleavage system transcriptional activator